jgi:hypothetical protein
VDLVQVDVVGPQPAQALLALVDDPAPRVPALIGRFPNGTTDLGCDDDVVSLGSDGLADYLFGLAVRVDIGGVDVC